MTPGPLRRSPARSSARMPRRRSVALQCDSGQRHSRASLRVPLQPRGRTTRSVAHTRSRSQLRSARTTIRQDGRLVRSLPAGVEAPCISCGAFCRCWRAGVQLTRVRRSRAGGCTAGVLGAQRRVVRRWSREARRERAFCCPWSAGRRLGARTPAKVSRGVERQSAACESALCVYGRIAAPGGVGVRGWHGWLARWLCCSLAAGWAASRCGAAPLGLPCRNKASAGAAAALACASACPTVGRRLYALLRVGQRGDSAPALPAMCHPRAAPATPARPMRVCFDVARTCLSPDTNRERRPASAMTVQRVRLCWRRSEKRASVSPHGAFGRSFRAQMRRTERFACVPAWRRARGAPAAHLHVVGSSGTKLRHCASGIAYLPTAPTTGSKASHAVFMSRRRLARAWRGGDTRPRRFWIECRLPHAEVGAGAAPGPLDASTRSRGPSIHYACGQWAVLASRSRITIAYASIIPPRPRTCVTPSWPSAPPYPLC